jgi:hypothetical protein
MYGLYSNDAAISKPWTLVEAVNAFQPCSNSKVSCIMKTLHTLLFSLVIAGALALGSAADAAAHCDSIDGPVVQDAVRALDAGRVDPVLKWVRAEDEAEVRATFDHVLTVRATGPEARALADRYFFETVVRLHRESENAPYTGLKPAGIDPGIVVRTADRSLESASDAEMVRVLTELIGQGLHERFTRMIEAHAHAEHNTDAGRAFVDAYVDYVHFAKALFDRATVHSAGQGNNAQHH